MKWNFLYQITSASKTPDKGATPPDPRSLCLLSSSEFVEPPPPKKIPGYATGRRCLKRWRFWLVFGGGVQIWMTTGNPFFLPNPCEIIMSWLSNQSTPWSEIVNYCYYYYYYYYLLELSFHLVAVVLTLVQTKQIGINIHKRNNTKTQYKQYKTQ